MASSVENGLLTVFSFLLPNELKKGVMIVAIATAVAAFALSFFAQSTFMMAGSALLGITGILGFISVEEGIRATQLEASLVTVNKQVKLLQENEKKEKDSIELCLINQRKTNTSLQGGKVHLDSLQTREKNLNTQLKESEKTSLELQKEVSALKASLETLEFGKKQLETNTAALGRTLQELEVEVTKSKQLADREKVIFNTMSSKIKDLTSENSTLKGNKPKKIWVCCLK